MIFKFSRDDNANIDFNKSNCGVAANKSSGLSPFSRKSLATNRLRMEVCHRSSSEHPPTWYRSVVAPLQPNNPPDPMPLESHLSSWLSSQSSSSDLLFIWMKTSFGTFCNTSSHPIFLWFAPSGHKILNSVFQKLVVKRTLSMPAPQVASMSRFASCSAQGLLCA